MTKILHLTLKKKWFDMIASGEKKEEYREIKEYWKNRFVSSLIYDPTIEQIIESGFRSFDKILFKNGYSKSAPTITVECRGIEIGKPKPEWSDNWQGDVFIIKLGKFLTHD